jgi:hypothetical protein
MEVKGKEARQTLTVLGQTLSFNGIVWVFSSSRASKFYSRDVLIAFNPSFDLSKAPLTTDGFVKLMKGIRRHHVANLVTPMAYYGANLRDQECRKGAAELIKCRPTPFFPSCSQYKHGLSQRQVGIREKGGSCTCVQYRTHLRRRRRCSVDGRDRPPPHSTGGLST